MPPPPKGEARSGAEHQRLALPLGELSNKVRLRGLFVSDYFWATGSLCLRQIREKTKQKTVLLLQDGFRWSEWRDSNSRPLEPHSSTLPKLSYTRMLSCSLTSAYLVYNTNPDLSRGNFKNFAFSLYAPENPCLVPNCPLTPNVRGCYNADRFSCNRRICL